MGAVVVLNDVTRLKRLEAVRRDFVANVSHELKTPVTSIKGFAETLEDGALDDPRGRAPLRAHHRGPGRPAELHHRGPAGAVDAGAAERQPRLLHVEEADVCDVRRRSAVEVCEPKAQAKGIALVRHVPRAACWRA